MGTTLTGTTPQDTYDSLIKVTDNGPLSGTAKYLSDGLGNDSALALSTGNIGVGNAAPAYKLDVTGDIRTNVASGNGSLYINNSSLTSKFWTFIPETAAGETNLLFFYGGTGAGTKMTLTNGGNVGIGTSAPAQALDVNGSIRSVGGSYDPTTSAWINAAFATKVAASPYGGGFSLIDGTAGWTQYSVGSGANLVFAQGATSGGTTAYATLTNGGYFRLSTGGIQFNGDTAAANALDDYEEGTFTAQLIPTTSGSITLNATYASFFYTKIGRQVLISGAAIVTSVASPVGFVRLEGLPFTANSATSNINAANIQYYDNSATSFIFVAAYMGNGVSRITTNIDASTVAAGDEIYFTHTYNV